MAASALAPKGNSSGDASSPVPANMSPWVRPGRAVVTPTATATSWTLAGPAGLDCESAEAEFLEDLRQLRCVPRPQLPLFPLEVHRHIGVEAHQLPAPFEVAGRDRLFQVLLHLALLEVIRMSDQVVERSV